ncbi:S66 family peptidase [Oenococcus sp.]|uniref:S66 family peptidase n=1 Tax=Oenococcus sp. TaxID=1979414 RepID=UPI0039E9D3BC
MTTIGYFSSSTAITALSPIRFQRAKTYLENKGITLIAGSLTGKSDFYRSGSIQARAAELNQLIYRDDVDIIMSTIGGSNTNSILSDIDFDYLRSHPKTFVGYSDATALLLAVASQASNCRVLYGPALVASFGEWPPYVDETWEAFAKIAFAKRGESVSLPAPAFWSDEALNWNEFQKPKQRRPNHWSYIGSPVLKGRLIGGNLNTMYGILSSKFFPKIQSGDVLFIEDAEKDAATVEKNFAMLKNAGIFDLVGGIILGKHAAFDDCGSGRRPIDILLEVLADKKIPIIYDYDSCHTVPMLTTPLMAETSIDALTGKVTFTDF